MTAPRFEICRGDDGWWARFRAANGRVVFVSETYTRRHNALKAILALAKAWDHLASISTAGGSVRVWCAIDWVEVREMDERTPEDGSAVARV